MFTRSNGEVGYNVILEYLTSNRIVTSRASMYKTVSGLTDIGLLEGRITQDRPVRVGYKTSAKGHMVIKYLDGIRQATT